MTAVAAAVIPDGADLDVARSVLAIEAAGLRALAAALDDRFGRAVDLLDGVTGRVVVSGMGKSGHVARKIAATLASTGTPALFVHPAEASHGDLGMITRSEPLRDAPISKNSGPRVVGILEKTLGEALLPRGLVVAEDTGNQAADRLDNHERGELASGDHVVADRDLTVTELVDNTLVDTLVAATKQ